MGTSLIPKWSTLYLISIDSRGRVDWVLPWADIVEILLSFAQLVVHSALSGF